MTIFESILLGALQGATEFIPVSSSGHLIVMRNFMNLAEIPLLYDVLLHISTLIVIIMVFHKRILKIIRSLAVYTSAAYGSAAVRLKRGSDARPVEAGSNKNRVWNSLDLEDRVHIKLAGLVIAATAITGALGVFISRFQLEQYPRFAASMFLVTGLILVAGKYGKHVKGYDKIGMKETIILGIIQGLAVLPGISRSGSTISAALLTGMNREEAGEFSFLISIPAVLGALVLTLARDSESLSAAVSPAALTAGLVSSFIVGLGALLFLIRVIRKGNLYIFSFYLIPLGIVSLLLL